MYTARTVISDSRRVHLPIKKVLPIAAIAVLGVAVSIGVMQLLDTSLRTKWQMEFDKAVASVVGRLEQGALTYEDVGRNLDGLFRNSVQVVRDVFELYSAIPAESNPAIKSMGYANFVRASELGEYTFYARSERYYNYSVHPAGERPEYVPVLYVVPYPEQNQLVGYDLLTRPELAEALQRARQKGALSTSRVFAFRGDTLSLVLVIPTLHKASNSEVLLPTAHSRFDGVIFVELDFRAFIRHSLGDSVSSDRNVLFSVIDHSDPRAPQVLIRVQPQGVNDGTQQSVLATQRPLTIGDRTFTIDFASAPHLTNGIERFYGIFAFIGGIIITLILCGFVLSVVSSRERALALADRITEGNRRILMSTDDIIGTITLDGHWRSINPAFERLLGYPIDATLGILITQHIATESDRIALLRALSMSTTEQTHVDVQMIAADGSIRWVSWSISISPQEHLAYVVGRDVTVERQAQAELELRTRQVQLAEQLALEATASKSAFIRRLTSYLRASLTTTLAGMHEMVMTMEPTNERQLRFVKLANESSDRLFAIVSDLLDVAQDQAETQNTAITLEPILQRARQIYQSQGGVCAFVSRSIDGTTRLCVEENVVAKALGHLYCAFSSGLTNGTIELTSILNTREYVLELQIVASYSPLVAQVIARYNREQHRLVESLIHDQGQVLFELGMAASKIRRMGGTFSVETLSDEGNVALITLPLA